MSTDCEVILGDSLLLMEAMAAHKPRAFDMVFLDPPYFEWMKQAGSKPRHEKLSRLVYLLLKPNGVAWLCGTQPQLLEDWTYWGRYFRLVAEIIEYKTGGTPPVNMYQPIRVHENIWLLYRKDMQISDSHLDIRRASKGRGEIVRLREPIDAMNIRYGGKWMEWREGVGYPKSVQECRRIDSSNPEYVGHPTQKPLDLMRLIVSISTDEGDLVLDPFAGSGTTLVACRELNRRCIGIEIERKYTEVIRWRLSRRVGKITEYY